jgi:WD40 repeat protein
MIGGRKHLRRAVRPIFCAAVLALASVGLADDKVNYQDHILPLFRNNCLNCHNPDKKKAGLDLSNYQAALAGSDSGPVVNAGDPDGSKLFRVVTHAEEPTMPPKRDKLPDKDLNLIKSWILGGVLETKFGKAVASAKPKVDLSVAATGAKKPSGPPPMPRDLVLEPFVHPSRAWAIDCMASSPWAPVVAIGAPHQVLLYNPQTLELLGVVPFPEGEPCVTRFSRNGKMLMIGGGVAAKSGKVVLWDITAGKRVTDVGDEFDQVLAADLSPDQTTVALGGPGKTLKVYSTQDGTLLHSVKKHTDWVTAIAYSPDGVLLASADRAGGLWVWEAKTAREFYNLSGHKAGVTAVAFRDDSNYLASASEDGTIKLWDMQSGNNVKSWNAHGGGVTSLAFTHDGRIVSCGRDRVVRIWNPNGSQIRQLDAFSDIALQATFDDDGSRVVAADWTGDVRVWDSKTGKLDGHLSPDPAPLPDRIVAAEQRLVELKATRDRLNAELDHARHDADRLARESQAAQQAIPANKKIIDDATAQVGPFEASVKAAQAARDATQALVTRDRSEVDRLTPARDRATASRDAALTTVSHEQGPSDATNVDGIVSLGNAAYILQCELDRASDRLKVSQTSLDSKSKEADGATARLAQKRDALTKARAALAAAEKSAPELAKELKALQTRLPKLQAEQASAESQLRLTTTELARMKVGQFFLNVYAARTELAARQAEQDQVAAAIAAAQAEADKANATVASLQKAIEEGPGRLKASEGKIAAAHQALAAAQAATGNAQAVVEQKQSLVAAADELARRIESEAGRSTGDQALHDAATKLKGVLDALSTDVGNARAQATARAQSAKSAGDAVAQAESALAREKTNLADAPKEIAAMKEKAAKLLADMTPKKASLADATKATAAAHAKADQLNAEYQKRLQQAGLDQPAETARNDAK